MERGPCSVEPGRKWAISRDQIRDYARRVCGPVSTRSPGSQLSRLARAVALTTVAAAFSSSGVGAATGQSPDYGPATWAPASTANYSVANRPLDYPVDMIVIHDTEVSYASAIADFQNPAYQASAHYVVSQTGRVAQMVLEKDIAWHAGNWDYNTRSIGIEHEGYAYTPYTFTTVEYDTSAHLVASICSRWGVHLDRQHVIGHYQVPDPNNPGLFGGSDHHTDPGPYWNWPYYMNLAQQYAIKLPSPPHMVPALVAVPGNTSATLMWPAARWCHVPITSYHVVGQPGNIVRDLPGGATSTTINGLQNGSGYTFTVTAINGDGQDSVTSNQVIPFTVPFAPSGVHAIAAGGSVVVSWTAPANGGRPITGYQVTPYANVVTQLPAVTFHQTNTLEVVSGLTNGVTYTFVVAAINIGGPGAPSAASDSAMPSAQLNPGTAQGPPSSPGARGSTQTSPNPTQPAR